MACDWTRLEAEFPDVGRAGLRGVRDVAGAVRATLTDPEVLDLPAGVGSAEQISDAVRVLVDPAARRRLVGA